MGRAVHLRTERPPRGRGNGVPTPPVSREPVPIHRQSDLGNLAEFDHENFNPDRYDSRTRGPYSEVFGWFVNYCVPILSSKATVVYIHLYSFTRWRKAKLTVSRPIRSLMEGSNLSSRCVQEALNELRAHDLIRFDDRPKARRQARIYTFVLYSAETARLKFTKPKVECARK
jgi:hypothetical protein